MKINLVKKLGSLIPLDEIDASSLSILKEGETYSCEIRKPRNLLFHRKFFAMIKLCFDNQEVFNSIDNFRKEMVKASGNYTSYKNHKGVEVFEAKSISFSSMSQDDFESLYESVFIAILRIFNWEDVKEQFREELSEFI